MKEIHVDSIIEAVRNICQEANFYLGDDVQRALEESLKIEESPTGKTIIEQILENAEIARKHRVPMCQDTGVAVFFVELGQEVQVVGGDFVQAINEGVRQGYREGYLRMSMVNDPLMDRKNTQDNTPAIIHTCIVPGDKLKITFAPKGGGSENMSVVRMMKPADGVEGVKDFVVDWVKRCGGNPCPPIIVGVGIGGTFEKCAQLAKISLLRDLGKLNADPRFASLEKQLKEKINDLGIGPMGLGGRVTALAVHIETHPCHIASLPVAVNIQCHAARHKNIVF